MAASFYTTGYNIAMDIVKTLPPIYWKKGNYESSPYLTKQVAYESNEFDKLCKEIQEAQKLYGVNYYDTVEKIYRIQNPYSYGRFMLRKKYLQVNNNSQICQDRRFKIIPQNKVDLALKYNCDRRRFGKANPDYRFYSTIPVVYKKRALLVVQVLSIDESDDEEEEDYSDDEDEDYSDDEDEDYSDDEDEEYSNEEDEDDADEEEEDDIVVECKNDSEFYIEYVVYFE